MASKGMSVAVEFHDVWAARLHLPSRTPAVGPALGGYGTPPCTSGSDQELLLLQLWEKDGTGREGIPTGHRRLPGRCCVALAVVQNISEIVIKSVGFATARPERDATMMPLLLPRPCGRSTSLRYLVSWSDRHFHSGPGHDQTCRTRHLLFQHNCHCAQDSLLRCVFRFPSLPGCFSQRVTTFIADL